MLLGDFHPDDFSSLDFDTGQGGSSERPIIKLRGATAANAERIRRLKESGHRKRRKIWERSPADPSPSQAPVVYAGDEMRFVAPPRLIWFPPRGPVTDEEDAVLALLLAA